jgi:hypothetical protein
MWVAAGKALVVGLPKIIGYHIMPLCELDAEHRAKGFNVCPAGPIPQWIALAAH